MNERRTFLRGLPPLPFFRVLLVLLVLLALSGAGGAARADVFARSYNDVTNFIISASGAIDFGETVDNSSATACLPNGHCVSNGGAGIPDTPPSQINWPGYADDSYATSEGVHRSYIVADASIDSHQIRGAPFTQARNFTEGQLLANDPGGNTANSTAGNSSASAFATAFTVTQPDTTLNFRFDANPYLKAYLSANAASTSQAEGSLALNLNIIDSTGKVVFNWAPDGVVGSILGGTEHADAFTLNTSLTALTGNAGPLLYDPANCPADTIISGCFNATTDALAVGHYSLNMSMRENVNLLSAVAPLPEPATYASLAAGLALLALAWRRKIVKNHGPKCKI